MIERAQFFATFGIGHEYASCYVEIHAENHHAARLFMMKAHGARWSSEIYPAERFASEITLFPRLMRLAVVRQSDPGPYITPEARFEVVRPGE